MVGPPSSARVRAEGLALADVHTPILHRPVRRSASRTYRLRAVLVPITVGAVAIFGGRGSWPGRGITLRSWERQVTVILSIVLLAGWLICVAVGYTVQGYHHLLLLLGLLLLLLAFAKARDPYRP